MDVVHLTLSVEESANLKRLVVAHRLQRHRIRPIQVLQSWRRHRHDSDVETGVVHRGDALGVDFEESGGELIIRRMDERNVLPSRLQCVPRVDQLGCREVFFQTNDLHVLDNKRVY